MRPSKAIRAARAASRANGARSRGAVTAAGKRRSSLNALRHGLLSKEVLLQNESGETFALHLNQHLAKFCPADDVEQGAVEAMVAASWRLRRLWTIETRLFDKSIGKNREVDERDRLAGAFSELAAGNELRLIDRYESRLNRVYRNSLRNFLLLREMGAAGEMSGEIAEIASDGEVGPSDEEGEKIAAEDKIAENDQTNLDSDNPLVNQGPQAKFGNGEDKIGENEQTNLDSDNSLLNQGLQVEFKNVTVHATGIGRPVVDLLRGNGLPCNLRPDIVTGGLTESYSDGFHRVPMVTLRVSTNKNDPITGLQMALRQETLQMTARGKPEPWAEYLKRVGAP